MTDKEELALVRKVLGETEHGRDCDARLEDRCNCDRNERAMLTYGRLTREAGLEDQAGELRDAAKFLRIADGWGHREYAEGERIAGFFYASKDAKAAGVLPAHCVGLIRSIILRLDDALRTPEEGKPS